MHERRIVTVFFCAIEESEQVPETRDGIESVLLRLREVIERHLGFVDKFLDRGVMALFGAPSAHEDDPLRAVRAGLAAQEIAGASLRIGINTGEVLWGELAGDRPTAIGDAVNVAQRLMSICPPGRVLVSRAVVEAARGLLRVRGIGPVLLKGRSQPVEAFEALGTAERIAPYRVPRAGSAPMLGRERELARLKELYASGRPAFVVVEGEAGMGKSRLLWEFRGGLVDLREPIVGLQGSCREGAILPREPFAEMIAVRAGVNRAGAAARQAILKCLGEDLERLSLDPIERENLSHLIALSVGVDVPDTRVKDIEPSRLLQETHFAWQAWLRAVTSTAPTLMVVEDLHWADEATLALLEFLARHFTRGRLLVLATIRRGGRPPTGFERMGLAPLGPAQARAICESVLEGPVTEPLAGYLQEKAGGNPYFLAEFARYLRCERLVVGPPFRLAAETTRLPGTLHGLLVSRLDRLAPSPRELLKGASAFGHTFWEGLLRDALEREVADDVRATLEEGLVVRMPDSAIPGDNQLAFQHALLRDAAYSLVTKKERARLHSRIAGLLERAGAEGGRRVRALAAGQWKLAGEAKRAADLWLKIAVEAEAEEVLEEAATAGRQARELAGSVPGGLIAARAFLRMGRVAEARAEIDPIRAAGPAGGDEKIRISLVEASALFFQGKYSDSLALLDREVPGDLKGGLFVEREILRARTLSMLGRFDEVLEAQRSALERSSRAGVEISGPDGRKMLAAFGRIASHILDRRGRQEEALDRVREALAMARAENDRRGVTEGLLYLASVERNFGRRSDAIGHLREALTAALRTGEQGFVRGVKYQLAICHAEAGEFQAARTLLEEALRISEERGDDHGIATAKLLMAEQVYAVTGPLERAETLLREAMETGTRESPPLARAAHEKLGPVLAEMGRVDEAEAAFASCLAEAKARGDAFSLGWSLLHRARLRLSRNRSAAREDAQAALAAWKETKAFPFNTGMTLSLLARLDALEGKGEDARAKIAEARRLVPQDGFFYAYLVVCEDCAAAWLACGEREKGLGLATQAARLAEEKGAKVPLARLCSLIERAAAEG